MTPKGRIIIIRSTDTDTTDEAEHRSASHHFPSKIFALLSEEKNARIEIITTSKDSTENCRKPYAELLEKDGYSNIGFIDIGKQDPDDYYSRISEAKVVMFDDNEQQICERLKNSAILKLLNKKYLHEDNFTVVGINTGAMCLSVLNDTGTINPGLGFINNCIIDTKFMHGERCKNLVKATIYHNECLGLGLKNGMALIIEKGYKAICLGNSSVMVVNAKDVKNKRLTRGSSVYKKNLKGHILTEGSVLNLLNGDLIKTHLFGHSLNFINRNTIQ
ncbi:cyanophycinase [Chryseobacterium ginsenosidimutans]|uniref:hypothetical protein n=1 Tax=Chryseobacterium ginsenosidimutans TaxID=687846 RepID=UPI002786C2F3|nr:hypothetical protein [Chryseobacterium ginsenosidimutans]MDQ0595094.1 cyanophycinase [Chryseobacterium ginsenosidimutans]